MSKAAKEIIANCDDQDFISIEQRSKIPFTEAALLEIWRLGPVGPIAATRYAEKDATVNGAMIPGGTLIFPLLYPMTVDPKKWTNPYKFDPMRHMKDGGERETLFTFGTGNSTTLSWHKDVQEKLKYVTGRRKCLGESVARIENVLFFANLIKHFKISWPTELSIPSDEELHFNVMDGLTIGPEYFPVIIEKRNN